MQIVEVVPTAPLAQDEDTAEVRNEKLQPPGATEIVLVHIEIVGRVTCGKILVLETVREAETAIEDLGDLDLEVQEGRVDDARGPRMIEIAVGMKEEIMILVRETDDAIEVVRDIEVLQEDEADLDLLT